MAIQELESRARREEFSIKKGTLFLIHGNPAASVVGKRHTEDGADLNRLFNFSFLDALPKKRWASEHYRAVELRPLLSSLDAALDIHSATAPTPPFGIVSHIPSSRPLARQLGLPYLTHEWEGPGMLADRVMMQMLSFRDKPSIAVECGQHEDPHAAERAQKTIAHFLVAVGMLAPEMAPALEKEPAMELSIVDAIKKPSTGFGLAGPFVGLQQMRAGALIGSDENLEVRCRRTCFVIMPNASVEVGNDMLYLAHQFDPNEDPPG
jgi:predicted deacylase